MLQAWDKGKMSTAVDRIGQAGRLAKPWLQDWSEGLPSGETPAWLRGLLKQAKPQSSASKG